MGSLNNGISGQWGVLSATGHQIKGNVWKTRVSEQQVFEQRGYHVLSMSTDVDVFYVDGKMKAFGKRQSNLQRRQLVPSRDSLCTAEPVDSNFPASLNYYQSAPVPSSLRSAPPRSSVLRTRQGYVHPLSKSKTTGSYFGHENMTMRLFYR